MTRRLPPPGCRIHAADVVRSLYCLLTQGGVLKAVWPEATDLGMLVALFCAVIHDYEHRGLNNDYLCKSMDDLAVREGRGGCGEGPPRGLMFV